MFVKVFARLDKRTIRCGGEMMALHKIIIRETREACVFVDTDYDFQALTKAMEDYNKGVIVTDREDIVDVDYEIQEDDDDIECISSQG